MSTNQQFSTIEYLVIDHCCSVQQLSTIISYTPQLSRLKFMHIDDDDLDIGIISPITLSNLTHLTMVVFSVMFDEFEMFISKLYSKLKYLRFTSLSEDIAYLDANRWERIILQYLPQLKKFYFKYFKGIEYENVSQVNFCKPDQFSSPFWIERQWVFVAKFDTEEIVYSIRPYKYDNKSLLYQINSLVTFRKNWYEFSSDKIVNSAIDLAKSPRLTIVETLPVELSEQLIMDINHVLPVSQIYYLQISEKKIFSDILIQIINSLPELHSLKIHSLSLYKSRRLTAEEVDIFLLAEERSKITKVCLESMVEIQEIFFLMTLCPYMAYLKVDCMNNMNVKFFLRRILEKIELECNDHLRSLCLHVPAADDKMIKKLEKMINVKGLLVDYTIKRVLDNIYLQWK